MIRKSDVRWWVLEATKHPESAPSMIEELAKRLVELDAENEQLRNEVIRLQQRAPARDGGTRVKNLERRVETLQALLQDQEPAGGSVVLLTDGLQGGRIPLSESLDLARAGRPVLDSLALLELRTMAFARPGEELLLVSTAGRGIRQRVADLPVLKAQGGLAALTGFSSEPGERLSAAIVVGEPPRFWTASTRKGYVQRLVRAACDRDISQGRPILQSPLRNDQVACLVHGDQGDVLLVTRWGKAVRFAQQAVETQGSVALQLDADDEVACALALASDAEMLLVTASGYVARRSSAKIGARSRPGGVGNSIIQARDVLAVYLYDAQASLMYVTYAGRLVVAPIADLPLHDRSSRGMPLCDLSRDPAIAAALIPTTHAHRA